MPSRHAKLRRRPPRLWLMTDERIADVEAAAARLPHGAGIVIRHHSTPPAERRALFERLRRIARARRIALVLAANPGEAVAWRADGVHGPGAGRRSVRPLLRTMAAHNRRELVAARRAGADLIFVSPVYATRSHPGARTLGAIGFGRIGEGGGWLIALGGMDARRFRALARMGAYGWAGIDALAASSKKI